MIASKIEDNHITTFRVNDSIISNKNIIGTFVKNTAELQIINLNHMYDNLKGEYIYIEGFGSWYVNDLETDEEYTESTLQLNDVTQKFDEKYDDSFLFPNTLKKWAIWIGEKVGVPFKGDFLKSDLILVEKPYLGNEPKYRDAVKFIAKITGNYAQKNYDNTYSIKWFDDTKINLENWESFVHGNATKPINVIVLSTGDTEENVKWPEIIPEEPHELRIEDDWINIDRYQLHEAIYNQVKGFFYIPISKLEVPFGLLNLRAGQKIKTKDIELQDIETFISSVTLEWQGGEFNNPNSWTTSIKMEELNETSTKLGYANSILNRVLNVERLADKNNGIIQDLIEETTEYEERITSVEQSTSEIIQKVESKIDFARNASGVYKLIVENAQEGPILKLGIKGEIELLYPSNDLYVSDDLYPLDTYLIIENEEGIKKRIFLPIDYLYKVDDLSDEFVVERIYNEDLELYEQHAKIIRRIYIDDNGNKFIASNEKIEDLGLIEINLNKGKNTIWLESFYDVPLNYDIEYAIENEFSKEFATKTELKTSIEQTEEKIELKASKDDVVSLINVSSEQIEIKGNRFVVESDNFKLTSDGEINSSSGKIGGWNIEENRLWCEIKPPHDYEQADLDKIEQYLLETTTLTSEEFEKYDIDKNGKVNARDLLICKQLILFNLKNSNPGKLYFDTSNWFQPIQIVNSSGEVVAWFGPMGAGTIGD